MTREELLQRLCSGESEDFEVKAAERGVPEDAYKTVSAFANTAGGWIIFGICERGDKLEVVGVTEPDRIQNDFLTTCRSSNKLKHPVDVAVTVIPFESAQVLAFYVKPLPRFDKPLRVRVKKQWQSYMRLGATDHRCTEVEEARFLRDASHESFDMTITETGLEDLDSEAIAWFRDLLTEYRVDLRSSAAEREPEAFLKRTGLLKKNGLTHAAALLFGLPQVMSHLKPGGIVDFRLFYADAHSASHHDWDDRELADGHIVGALRTLLERLRRLSPNPFEMEPNGVQHRALSRDFLAVREAFMNLLIHQDYSDLHRTARILWYRDRVLFENPGDSYLTAAEMRDGGSAPRNPLLTLLMRQAGFIEQAGRGVVRILERWRESGREPPEIANDPGRKIYGLWLSWQLDRTASEPVAVPPGLSRDSLPAAEPLRVGVCSFVDWADELGDWSQAFLPLSGFFRGRDPLAEVGWPEIYSRLAAFLKKELARQRAIHLDLAAHQSIAFAAGYLVGVEAGIEITVRQRSARGTEDWRIDDPETAGAPSWQVEDHPLGGDGVEIALAISSARPILTSVEKYVRANLPAVERMVEFKPPQGPGLLSVADGGHAFRLAEAISHKIYRLEQSGGPRRFHLFYAGPNGLLFFLGRLSRGPGKIQLYEYDFDSQGRTNYAPSLLFPPAAPSETAST